MGTLTRDFLGEFLLTDILAFFAGNIGADFVRRILTLFFWNILTYFHGPINTVHAGSIYTQTFLATRWQGSSGTMHTWCSTRRSATSEISLHNYLGTDRAVNLAGTAHLVNIVQAALFGDLLAYLASGVTSWYISCSTPTSHTFLVSVWHSYS